MISDTLYLLDPGFADPALPGLSFFCSDCMLFEGMLARFPDLARRLEVRRLAFPRPRMELIEHVGVDNQTMPLLILAEDPHNIPAGAERYGDTVFVKGREAIVASLVRRHGFPVPHP